MPDAKGIAAVHVAAWRVAYRGLLPDEVLDRLSIDDIEKRWANASPSLGGTSSSLSAKVTLVGFAACGSSEGEDMDRETVGEI